MKNKRGLAFGSLCICLLLTSCGGIDWKYYRFSSNPSLGKYVYKECRDIELTKTYYKELTNLKSKDLDFTNTYIENKSISKNDYDDYKKYVSRVSVNVLNYNPARHVRDSGFYYSGKDDFYCAMIFNNFPIYVDIGYYWQALSLQYSIRTYPDIGGLDSVEYVYYHMDIECIEDDGEGNKFYALYESIIYLGYFIDENSIPCLDLLCELTCMNYQDYAPGFNGMEYQGYIGGYVYNFGITFQNTEE